MKTKPKILVIGHAGHGKTTVCEMLAADHGFRFEDSSRFAFDMFIWASLYDMYGSRELAWIDKKNRRALWFELIRLYTRVNPCRLAEEILEHNDIYCGMRRAEEFEASKHLFDYILAVKNTNKPGESRTSMNIDTRFSDYTISNDGTLSDLSRRVDGFVEWLDGQDNA